MVLKKGEYEWLALVQQVDCLSRVCGPRSNTISPLCHALLVVLSRVIAAKLEKIVVSQYQQITSLVFSLGRAGA